MTTTTTAPDAALLPCAHCGSADVEIRTSLTDELIACNNCGARTGLIWLCDSEAVNAKRRRQLVAAWNRRAGQSYADAALLWAEKNARYGTARHYGLMGFRAGQSHADAGLLAALEAAPIIGAFESPERFRARQDVWLDGVCKPAIAAAKGESND